MQNLPPEAALIRNLEIVGQIAGNLSAARVPVPLMVRFSLKQKFSRHEPGR